MSAHTPALSMYRGFILSDGDLAGTYAHLADENRRPIMGDDAVELFAEFEAKHDITELVDEWLANQAEEAAYEAEAAVLRRKANNLLIYATVVSATQSLLADQSFHALANGEADAIKKGRAA